MQEKTEELVTVIRSDVVGSNDDVNDVLNYLVNNKGAECIQYKPECDMIYF